MSSLAVFHAMHLELMHPSQVVGEINPFIPHFSNTANCMDRVARKTT